MYYYQVGYNSYEECPSYTLMSKTLYNQEEFDELISNVFIEVYNKNKKLYRIDTLLTNVLELLVEKYNFIAPKVECNFSPFGWASIIDKNDWNHDRDKQLTLITNKLTKT